MTTQDYKQRRRRFGLTAQQRSAIDLILAGANDRQVAEQVGVHRVTVTNWRLHDPDFQVALSTRLSSLWTGAANVIRTVLPEALDSLREQLRSHPNRGRLALDFVFRAGLLGRPYAGDLATMGVGPLTMDELLDQEVLHHRAATGQPTAGEDGSPLPISDEERDAAYDRLVARANAPVPDDEAEDPAPSQPSAAPQATVTQTPLTLTPVPQAPVIATPTPSAAPSAPEPSAPVTTRRMSAFS